MARRMRRSTPSYTTKPECPHCGSTITSVIYSPGPHEVENSDTESVASALKNSKLTSRWIL